MCLVRCAASDREFNVISLLCSVMLDVGRIGAAALLQSLDRRSDAADNTVASPS